jgi:antitoxin component YwqK of YwqJK toxin-antitoxin module
METKVELTYYSNGELRSERSRVDGKLHGMVKHWYQNGQLRSERPYVDGMPHGMIKWWYRDGQLGAETFYVDGVIHGVAKWWSPNGDIDEFRLWNQDKLVAKFYPRNQTQRWKLK